MRSLVLAISAAVSVVACGSSPSSSPSVTPTELRGTYAASSPGLIVQIDFLDGTHDEVTWSTCSSGKSCTRAGTYELTGAETELALTDAVTHETTTLAFQVLSGYASTQSDDLRILGGSLTSGTNTQLTSGSGGPLTSGSGSGLTTGSGGSLTSQQMGQLLSMIQSFLAGMQGSGSGSGSQTPTNSGSSTPSGSGSSFPTPQDAGLPSFAQDAGADGGGLAGLAQTFANTSGLGSLLSQAHHFQPPSTPSDCKDGICTLDDTSFWEQREWDAPVARSTFSPGW